MYTRYLKIGTYIVVANGTEIMKKCTAQDGIVTIYYIIPRSISLVSRRWSIFDEIQIVYLQIINNRPFSND